MLCCIVYFPSKVCVNIQPSSTQHCNIWINIHLHFKYMYIYLYIIVIVIYYYYNYKQYTVYCM